MALVVILVEEDFKETIYWPGIIAPVFAHLPTTHSSGCCWDTEALLSFLQEVIARAATNAANITNGFNGRIG